MCAYKHKLKPCLRLYENINQELVDDQSANKTLKGIEAMNMTKKGQVNDLNYSVFNEVKYINQLFGLVL